MHKIAILQLGDVHYPSEKERVLIDMKDGSFPRALADTATPNVLSAAVAAVARTASERADLKALLITGDLTDYGDMDGYRACVEFLTNAFMDVSPWGIGEVYNVPGNHDVDRDSKGEDRFLRVASEWTVGSYTYKGVGWAEIGSGPAKLGIVSLNSCLGCGEWWGVPDDIRDDLIALLTKAMRERGIESAFELTGKQLDTPAFARDDVEAAISAMRSPSAPAVSVLLAHHALLAQRLVRIEMYTELINSGFMRARLLDSERPVIYLHGHVHTDTIEIIRSPKQPGHIVSIAAPRLADGFNIVVVHYSASGVPVGVEVIEYRECGYGAFEERLRHRQRLHTVHTAAAACEEDDIKVLERIPTGSAVPYRKLADGLEGSLRESLPNRLDMLDWVGLIEITNNRMGFEPIHWHIRRTGP